MLSQSCMALGWWSKCRNSRNILATSTGLFWACILLTHYTHFGDERVHSFLSRFNLILHYQGPAFTLPHLLGHTRHDAQQQLSNSMTMGPVEGHTSTSVDLLANLMCSWTRASGHQAVVSFSALDLCRDRQKAPLKSCWSRSQQSPARTLSVNHVSNQLIQAKIFQSVW